MRSWDPNSVSLSTRSAIVLMRQSTRKSECDLWAVLYRDVETLKQGETLHFGLGDALGIQGISLNALSECSHFLMASTVLLIGNEVLPLRAHSHTIMTRQPCS